MTNPADYRLILACYRSGQISPEQWENYMSDEVFAAWFKKNATRAA